MTNWTQATGPGDAPKSNAITDVACPFCGLVCDDLELARDEKGLHVTKNGCERAIAGFERNVDGAKPQVDGRDVDLATAIQAATALIRKSSLPLFGGLGTDVNGIRAVMALADKAGGVVDHGMALFYYGIFAEAEARFANGKVKLHHVSTWRNVLAVARAQKLFDEATLASVEAFLNAPLLWSADHGGVSTLPTA